jgi:hypothetical protein
MPIHCLENAVAPNHRMKKRGREIHERQRKKGERRLKVRRSPPVREPPSPIRSLSTISARRPHGHRRLWRVHSPARGSYAPARIAKGYMHSIEGRLGASAIDHMP